MAEPKKQPSGKWRVRVRVSGHPPQSKTFRTKQLAKTWATHIEDELASGLIIGGNIPKGYAVKDLLHWYERKMTSRKKGRDVESCRIKLLSEKLGANLLVALKPLIIVDYADERLLSVKSDTVRRELTVLSAAIDAAIFLLEFKFDNPVNSAIKLLKLANTLKPVVKRNRRLVGDEYSRIIDFLKKNNPKMADVVTLLVESAMRRGDLVKFSGKHLSQKGLLIEGDKMGKTSVIPVSLNAREIMGRYPNGFGLKGSSITQAFRRACRRLDIPDLRPHDLRHEAASSLFEKGLGIQQVAKITRQSFATLEKYTHPRNEDIEKLLD